MNTTPEEAEGQQGESSSADMARTHAMQLRASSPTPSARAREQSVSQRRPPQHRSSIVRGLSRAASAPERPSPRIRLNFNRAATSDRVLASAAPTPERASLKIRVNIIQTTTIEQEPAAAAPAPAPEKPSPRIRLNLNWVARASPRIRLNFSQAVRLEAELATRPRSGIILRLGRVPYVPSQTGATENNTADNQTAVGRRGIRHPNRSIRSLVKQHRRALSEIRKAERRASPLLAYRKDLTGNLREKQEVKHEHDDYSEIWQASKKGVFEALEEAKLQRNRAPSTRRQFFTKVHAGEQKWSQPASRLRLEV